MIFNFEISQNQKFWEILDYQYSDEKNEMDSFSVRNVSAGSKLSIQILTEGLKLMNVEKKGLNIGKIHYYWNILESSACQKSENSPRIIYFEAISSVKM